MKIICDNCGNNSLIKIDGFFVCQRCETKYNVRQAKKLFYNDSLAENEKMATITKYMYLAEEAYVADNCTSAEVYCQIILETDPTYAEAWVLKGIASAWNSSMYTDRTKELYTSAERAFSLAKKADELFEYGKRAYHEAYTIAVAFAQKTVERLEAYSNEDTKVEYHPSVKNAFNIVDSYYQHLKGLIKIESKIEDYIIDNDEYSLTNLLNKINAVFIESGIKIWNKALHQYNMAGVYPSDFDFTNMNEKANIATAMLRLSFPYCSEEIEKCNRDTIIKACKNLVIMFGTQKNMKSYHLVAGYYSMSNKVNLTISSTAKQTMIKLTNWCYDIIKFCDPSYVIPESAKESQVSKKSGCYIATAVYGSYDCPQVWTLRRYRDNTLASTWYGRMFIRVYYAVSPTLVMWFGDTQWFKRIWKNRLDRKVSKLKEHGVEDTPYEDQKWL
jgi:hypothetical protein